MHKLFLPIFASFCFLANFSASAAEDAAAVKEAVTQEKYTNAQKNYTIEYSSKWKKGDVPQLDLVLFAPDTSGKTQPTASINVVSENVGAKVPLQTFFDESLTNLKSTLKDVQIENKGEASLNGTPSKWVSYTHVMQNIKLRVLQYFVVSGETIYLITFSAADDDFQNYKKEFEQIASTFTITK
jgi:hypothetical protein